MTQPPLLVLKMEEGDHELQVAGKGKEMDSLLEPSEENAINYLGFYEM